MDRKLNELEAIIKELYSLCSEENKERAEYLKNVAGCIIDDIPNYCK